MYDIKIISIVNKEAVRPLFEVKEDNYTIIKNEED